MTPQVQKLLIDFGPLLAFFIANWRGGIYWGTGVFMAATAVALAVSWFTQRKLPVMLLIGAGFVAVFGGLTLYLQDATFIKVKVSLINALFGVALLGGLAFGRIFLKTVMGEALQMADQGWRKLTLRTGLFFFAVAILNEAIWRTQTETFWVNFKVFGILPLTFIFFAAQTPLMLRYAIPEQSGDGGITKD